MKSVQSEQLLGYLLGALDDAERLEVERILEVQPSLREQLGEMQRQISPLAFDEIDHEPPGGLADRVAQWVFATGGPPPGVDAPVPARSFHEAWGEPARKFGLADVVVACGIFFAAALLFFPAIAHSRFHSQLAICQNNLRQVGIALEKFSQLHGNRFPEVPAEGKLSGAGIYGPILWENQLITDPRLLLCPTWPQAKCEKFSIPTREEILAAEDVQLVQMRRNMGGSYGYSLGYMDRGEYRAPANQRRATFPIMSDAPSLHLAGHQSANHGGRGQNVLYEDGHLQYLVDPRLAGDDLYLSDRGFIEAGEHPFDAVIGGSESMPLSFPR